MPVTPLVGVWIEMLYGRVSSRSTQVTPLVGVWIEKDQSVKSTFALDGHSPCGSVD